MDEKELTAYAIGPEDLEFKAGVYPVSIPQQGKELRVLVIHTSHMDDECREGKPEGWYFSLETRPNSIWGAFPNAKDAFFGALKMLAEDAMTEAMTEGIAETVEGETIDIKPTTLH